MASSSSGADDVTLYVNGLQSSCNEEMRQPSLAASIYKVPEKIRASRPEAYHPQVVQLGLFHTEKKPEVNPNVVEMLMPYILPKAKEIRDCYEGTFHYAEVGIARMVTRGACYILQFYGNCQNMNKKHSMQIMRDIFMLENQIPLFVLLDILPHHPFTRVPSTTDPSTKLAEMLTSHPPFQMLLPFQNLPFTLNQTESELEHLKSNVKQHISEGAFHLLDLFTKMITDFLTHDSLNSERTSLLGSHGYIHFHKSVELKKFGIKFKKSTNGEVLFAKTGWCRFNTLFLPQINLEKDTEPLLRNLMAFVDRPGKDTLVCQFMIIMNYLIRSEKENVALLRTHDIVNCGMESDENIAYTFRNLCNEIPEDYSRFRKVVDHVTEQCSGFNRWLNKLLSDLMTVAVWIACASLIAGLWQVYHLAKQKQH